MRASSGALVIGRHYITEPDSAPVTQYNGIVYNTAVSTGTLRVIRADDCAASIPTGLGEADAAAAAAAAAVRAGLRVAPLQAPL